MQQTIRPESHGARPGRHFSGVTMSARVQKKIRRTLGQMNREMNASLHQSLSEARRKQVIRSAILTSVVSLGLLAWAVLR